MWPEKGSPARSIALRNLRAQTRTDFCFSRRTTTSARRSLSRRAPDDGAERHRRLLLLQVARKDSADRLRPSQDAIRTPASAQQGMAAADWRIHLRTLA